MNTTISPKFECEKEIRLVPSAKLPDWTPLRHVVIQNAFLQLRKKSRPTGHLKAAPYEVEAVEGIEIVDALGSHLRVSCDGTTMRMMLTGWTYEKAASGGVFRVRHEWPDGGQGEPTAFLSLKRKIQTELCIDDATTGIPREECKWRLPVNVAWFLEDATRGWSLVKDRYVMYQDEHVRVLVDKYRNGLCGFEMIEIDYAPNGELPELVESRQVGYEGLPAILQETGLSFCDVTDDDNFSQKALAKATEPPRVLFPKGAAACLIESGAEAAAR